MAIKALDIGKITDYICENDDPDDPTIFKLGTLSARDKGAIQDTLTSFSISDDNIERMQEKKSGKTAKTDEDDEGGDFETKIERSKMQWEAVRRGLKGWENFLDSNGEPIPFKLVTRDMGGGVKKSVVPNDLLDILPYDVMVELATKIMKDFDNGDEAGNSQEPSMGGSSTPTESAESADPINENYEGA